MFLKYINEFFKKTAIKLNFFRKKLESTPVYYKFLEINKIFLDWKNKLKSNELIILFYDYKNNLFLKDVDKIRLFFYNNLFDKASMLYKKNLLFLNTLYVNYLQIIIIVIIDKIKIFVKKYQKLEKEFSIFIENDDVSNKKNYILKQNKSISYSSLVTILGSRQKNKIYVANASLWQAYMSDCAELLVLLFVCILHNQNFISFLNKQVIVAIFGGAISISFWITTFYKEKQLGFHTYEVRRNIRLGFYIFIFTEAICFLSLFWTFLHALLAASLNIGLHNPGEGIVHFWMTETRLFHPYWEKFYYLEGSKALLVNLTDCNTYRNKKVFDKNLVIKVHINLHDKGQLINPYKFPLMNTFILLASACSLNASHTQIKMGKYLTALIWLSFTILLGLSFAFIQYKEIKECSIQFTDGIYGSCFYSLTGLHGTHVILGIFGLFICFLNFLKHNYSQKRHDTYWFAILYWHFVDIIWILVYLIIYIWPSFFFHRSGVRWVQLDFNSYCFNFSEEAFENTLYLKLYRDRIKLNHDILKRITFRLDEQNLFLDSKHLIFNTQILEKNSLNFGTSFVPDYTIFNIRKLSFFYKHLENKKTLIIPTSFCEYLDLEKKNLEEKKKISDVSKYNILSLYESLLHKKFENKKGLIIPHFIYDSSEFKKFENLSPYYETKKHSFENEKKLIVPMYVYKNSNLNEVENSNVLYYETPKNRKFWNRLFTPIKIYENSELKKKKNFYFFYEMMKNNSRNKKELVIPQHTYENSELKNKNLISYCEIAKNNLHDNKVLATPQFLYDNSELKKFKNLNIYHETKKNYFEDKKGLTVSNHIHENSELKNKNLNFHYLTARYFERQEQNEKKLKLINELGNKKYKAFFAIYDRPETKEHYDMRTFYETPVKKKISVLNKLRNKSRILDASNILYDLMPYFNYNGIKKRNAEHAIALNIIHFAVFQEIQTQEAYDLLNKKYKIFMFFILSCIDRKLCFIWCKYFTPYYLQN